MTSTEQAQRSAAVERLLDAAAEAFADKGFHATTTRDIAARVGLSPAAVYVHFASKEELLYELSLVGHQAALGDRDRGRGAAHRATRPRSCSGRGRLRGLARAPSADRSGRAVRAGRPDARASRGDPRGCGAQIQDRVRDLLTSGVAAGAVRRPDVPGTALALLSLVVDVARWYDPAGARSPEDVGALYADLALRMVAGQSRVSLR